jgi:hypothetical protein
MHINLVLLAYSVVPYHHTEVPRLEIWNNKIKTMYFVYKMGRVAQSVYQLATGWTSRGSNPGGSEIFRTRPDRSRGPPNLLYNGYRVFPGGKAAGA